MIDEDGKIQFCFAFFSLRGKSLDNPFGRYWMQKHDITLSQEQIEQARALCAMADASGVKWGRKLRLAVQRILFPVQRKKKGVSP